MEEKIIEFGSDVHSKFLKATDRTADFVAATMGPKGKNIVMSKGRSTKVTKDGIVTINNRQFEVDSQYCSRSITLRYSPDLQNFYIVENNSRARFRKAFCDSKAYSVGSAGNKRYFSV